MAMKIETEIVLFDSNENTTRLTKDDDGIWIRQNDADETYFAREDLSDFLKAVKAFVAA